MRIPNLMPPYHLFLEKVDIGSVTGPSQVTEVLTVLLKPERTIPTWTTPRKGGVQNNSLGFEAPEYMASMPQILKMN